MKFLFVNSGYGPTLYGQYVGHTAKMTSYATRSGLYHRTRTHPETEIVVELDSWEAAQERVEEANRTFRSFDQAAADLDQKARQLREQRSRTTAAAIKGPA